MSDVLIRGISPLIYQRIQRFAKEENLSINQMFLRLITSAVEESEVLKKAFRRIRGIQEENF